MVAVRSVELVRLSEEFVRVRGVGKRSRVPKDLRKRVLSLVTSGVSVGQVARSCGLSASLIYKWRTELFRPYRSEGLVKRLTVVSDSIKPDTSSSPFAARIVVKDIVIEIDVNSLPDVISALRAIP